MDIARQPTGAVTAAAPAAIKQFVPPLSVAVVVHFPARPAAGPSARGNYLNLFKWNSLLFFTSSSETARDCSLSCSDSRGW